MTKTRSRAAFLVGLALVVGAAVWAGARPAGAGGDGDAKPNAATVEQLDAEWARIAHPTAPQYAAFLWRYRALGLAAAERTKAFAKEAIEKGDPDDRMAHEVLGHKEFAFEVPEEVAYRRHPFLRAVEEAHEQRWFDDDAAYARALEAWEQTKRHAARLSSDRAFRALDGARQQVDGDPFFKDYVYESISAPPYLVCYSDGTRFDAEALARLPRAERRRVLDGFDEKKKGFRRALAEKARIFQQTYAEFMRRYAEPCDLKDLMAEFGGRADLPMTKRSYRDGCPLIVWVFTDKQAFTEHHEKVRQEGISPDIAGYFSHKTGWVYSYDEPSGDREFEVLKDIADATRQLVHWFCRQQNEWAEMVDPKDGRSRVPESWFSDGLAGHTGAVTMAPDRTLTFIGFNRPRLEALQLLVASRSRSGAALTVIPVKDLVGLEGHANAVQWAAEHWGGFGAANGLHVFTIESCAFVQFLNDYAERKYRPAFTRLVADVLTYPRNGEHYLYEKFKAEFGIASDDDWKRLDDEFNKYYLGTLATMDLATLGKPPPDLADWPGYVEPDLLSTTGPR